MTQAGVISQTVGMLSGVRDNSSLPLSSSAVFPTLIATKGPLAGTGITRYCDYDQYPVNWARVRRYVFM